MGELSNHITVQDQLVVERACSRFLMHSAVIHLFNSDPHWIRVIGASASARVHERKSVWCSDVGPLALLLKETSLISIGSTSAIITWFTRFLMQCLSFKVQLRVFLGQPNTFLWYRDICIKSKRFLQLLLTSRWHQLPLWKSMGSYMDPTAIPLVKLITYLIVSFLKSLSYLVQLKWRWETQLCHVGFTVLQLRLQLTSNVQLLEVHVW